jgi:hypothetical protein
MNDMDKHACPVVDGASICADEDTRERANQLIKEAFRILVCGTKITRIIQLDCLPCRAGYAIRHIADLLSTQAQAYRLDADLWSALECISQGLETELPDDEREIWDEALDSDARPWVGGECK